MRGTLAKRLRARTLANVPTAVLLSLSDEPRYKPVPGTGRRKQYKVLVSTPNSLLPMFKDVEIPTVTFALSADCRRHYTQRLKRAYVRQQRSPT
jgi:hypothetical protein